MGTQTMIILLVVGMAVLCHWNQIQILVSLTNLVQLLTNQRRKVKSQRRIKSRDQNCEVTKEGFWKIKESSFCPWYPYVKKEGGGGGLNYLVSESSHSMTIQP